MRDPKTKIKESSTEFYYCNSCKIDTDTKDRICPCPRANCKAELLGHKKVTIKTEYLFFER